MDATGVIVGIDEAGRGPLAGPVIAAAVILNPGTAISGLTDSKRLSAARRSKLYELIHERALSIGLGRADVEEIDRINILQASLLAMKRAFTAMDMMPDHALVDGNHCPGLGCSVEPVVNGDSLIPSISAASIIAKVYRDREMIELDRRYPGYDFARNKGYPTRAHIDALHRLGVTPVHRRSFRPVADCL
ncbi:MAG: ribonuclease HII [Gammaproteobacteria bacterium]|nr:ribonuclease HII [Gammaproteobacteria bacterium]